MPGIIDFSNGYSFFDIFNQIKRLSTPSKGSGVFN
jgi:hypothetical protein